MTTTLNLSLTHNDYFLEINDINSEYSTVHLTLGNTNSALEFNDNGLTTLDTPTAGTGALDERLMITSRPRRVLTSAASTERMTSM